MRHSVVGHICRYFRIIIITDYPTLTPWGPSLTPPPDPEVPVLGTLGTLDRAWTGCHGVYMVLVGGWARKPCEQDSFSLSVGMMTFTIYIYIYIWYVSLNMVFLRFFYGFSLHFLEPERVSKILGWLDLAGEWWFHFFFWCVHFDPEPFYSSH